MAQNMTNSYDEKSCIFGCRLRYALKKAGCVPWDYPVPEDMVRTSKPYEKFLQKSIIS